MWGVRFASLIAVTMSGAIFVLGLYAFQTIQELSRQNAELRLAGNRRMRALSNFALPGFTPQHLERITRTAQDFGNNWQFPAAIYSVEQGGDGLENGIQALPPFVAKNYEEAFDHQFAALQVMIVEELNKFVFDDLQRRAEFVTHYAKRHNQDPPKYAVELQQRLDSFMVSASPTAKPDLKIPKREGRRASSQKVHKKNKRGAR